MIIQQNNPVGNYAGRCKTICILFIVLMATSCNMSRVAIDVLVPAENDFDTPLTNCGWINRVNPGKGYIEYYINGSFVNKTSHFNDRLCGLTMRRVEQFSNDLGYLEVHAVNVAEQPPSGTFDGPLMRRSMIEDICYDYKLDYLIALEGFDTDIDVEQSVTYSPGVDRNFGLVSVPMFDGLQTVTMRMFFRIYDKKGNLIKVNEEATQTIYSSTGDYPLEMQRKMRSSDGLLNDAAEKIADLYFNQISPHWVKRSRSVYSSGSAELIKAYEYVLMNNWEFASDIWYKLASSENKKVAKKAAFNMIVASEVAGDLDLAIQWANTSIQTYKSNKALSYLSELKQRKKEIKKIPFPKN